MASLKVIRLGILNDQTSDAPLITISAPDQLPCLAITAIATNVSMYVVAWKNKTWIK